MVIKGCNSKKDFVKNKQIFAKNIYTQNSSNINEGIEEFKKFFYIKDKKYWKDFIIKPEFLRVQFDERFVYKLANFLKYQTSYQVKKLPFDMVKELYFAYYPFIEEEKEELFKDGFYEFFNVLFENENIEDIIEKHEDPNLWNEVIKYSVYYGLYKSVKNNGSEQEVELWEGYIREISGREFYLKDDVKTNIDTTIYPMIAFLISEAPRFSDEIYGYLIDAFDLSKIKYTSKLKMLEPIYKAIEEKGVLIESLKIKQEVDRKEILFLMEKIKELYSLEDESDRKKIKEFFEREILLEHFKAFINKKNYEWDLLDDGHLYALKRNNTYEFIYDKVEEKVTLSCKEYLDLLEKLLDLYMGKYFCTLSEKEKWKTLRESAEDIYVF